MEKSKDEIWKDLLEEEKKHGKDCFSLSHRPKEIISQKIEMSSIIDIQHNQPLEDLKKISENEFTLSGKPFSTPESIQQFTSEETIAQGTNSNKATDSNSRVQSQEVLGHDFILGQKIGQGGMGAIFRGKQISLQRDVAIKVLHGNTNAELFVSEARVTGGLEHGNIVPIHHFGFTKDGSPHLAMKLVKGKSWLDVLREEERTLKEHIRILITVCNAIAYAHEHKIVHRDLKLENIMIGEFGEIFVMDWGLAVSCANEINENILHVSAFQSPCGTPTYMAPELATGEGENQGLWTDIYLLGACLHHVVMKKSRHTGTTLTEVLNNAIESAPFPYPQNIPRELADICNKAMHKNPEKRFATVEKFQHALEKFLEHEQANQLIWESNANLEELKEAISKFPTVSSEEKEDLTRKIHRLDGEIVFGFEQALKIWKDAEEAQHGLLEENKLMLEYALDAEDLGFAQYLLSRREISGYQEKVDQLRRNVDAQKEELVHLRETARGHNWEEIASPLGTISLFSAILGSLGCFFTGSVLRNPNFEQWVIFPLWGIIGSIFVALAYFQSRRLRIRSVVSEDIIGMWFVVGIVTLLVGVINQLLDLPPFRMIGVVSLLIGIGIANMALDTKKWLFIPSGVFFLGGIVMAAIADYGLEIFGFLWLVSLMTIGIYFKVKSFSLEEDEGIVDISTAEYNLSGGFITFVLLFFGYLCYYLTRTNISIAQLSMVKMNVLSQEEITTITSWGIVFYAIGKFTNGMITDIIGGKSIFILGMIGSIFSTCMFATGENYYWFLGWWCCNFYFLSMGWSGLIKVCSHWYATKKQRGTIMGLLSFSYQMGEAIAKIFTTFLMSFTLLVWQGLFFVPAAILTVAAIIVFLFLKEQPSNKQMSRETPNIKIVIKTLFSSPAFLLLIWAAFALTMVRGFFQFYTPVWLTSKGLNAQDASYTSSLLPIAGMVGAFSAGWISDRMLGNRGPVLVIPCTILSFLLFANQLFTHTIIANYVFLILGGVLIYSAYSVLAGVAAVDIGGNQAPATTAGILDGFGYLGYALGSFLLISFRPDQLLYFYAALNLLMSLTLIPLWKIYPTKPLEF